MRAVRRPPESFERPVFAPGSAFFDPPFDQLRLRRRQAPVGFQRRHSLVGIVRHQPPVEFAARGIAGLDDRDAVFRPQRVFLPVEPQFRFPLFGIRPVAEITIFGQDGLDIAIEYHRRFRLRCRAGAGEH